MRTLRVGLVGASLLAVAGCVDRLPDQDRRIVAATPVAKMSVDDLWKDYQSNPTNADRMYHGRAVEVSGKVSVVSETGAPAHWLLFVEQAPNGVRANLLEDQAVEVLSAATPGERITLKCFCEGLAGDVVLKSCVRPSP